MNAMQAPATHLNELLREHREGFSLPQALYVDPGVFDADLHRLSDALWMLAGHVSMVPNVGDYFLFEIGKESLIVVRDGEQSLGAFYNVCRHRGSRICLEAHGSRNVFVCPYHAWSYKLDGSLLSARLMSEDFDRSQYGLHRCHLQLLEGLIFISLAAGDAPAGFEEMARSMAPMLAFQGLGRAKIAARRDYPTRGNWKLVVENFLECYHCDNAHPEYCSVHPREQRLAVGAGEGSGPADAAARYEPIREEWRRNAKALGNPVGSDHGAAPSWSWGWGRSPVGRGFLSETLDGKPASSLMGEFQAFDGGMSYFAMNALNTVIATNDFAVLVQFVPRAADATDVTFTWLVDAEARAGVDYDVERLTALWDVTTKQDKRIVENNQAGILSTRYQPGPYSAQEASVVSFLRWYKDLHLRA